MIKKFHLPPLVTCKLKHFQTHDSCLSRIYSNENIFSDGVDVGRT